MNFNWVLDTIDRQIPAGDPDKTAVRFDLEASLSYAELRELSLRYATALRGLGLGKGDRLGLILYNDVEYIPLYLAASRLGVVPVRINFRLAPPEVAFILEDSGADALVVHSSLVEKVGPAREQLDLGRVFVLRDSEDPIPDWAEDFDALRGAAPLDPADAPEVGPDDPLTLAYTSGTTGNPKGAIWTHGNTMSFGTMQCIKWQFSRDTVALVPGPVYHAGGFETMIVPALVAGGTGVCIRSGGFSVEHLVDVINEVGATEVLLFSFMFYELLRLPNIEQRLSPTVKRLLVGGDTVFPWAFEDCSKRFPDIGLYQLYGLTEGGAITTTLDPQDLSSQPNSIGRPMPFAEAQVVTGEGALAAPDEVGEIWVRSPAVSPGYWQRPEVNEKTFVDGWCRTGDLGSVNADGYLSLAGRAKDMIRSGGENIYPAEVEKVLTKHEAVSDAAVIGVPHERFNEVGCAIVILKGDAELDTDALALYCREHMAGYKVPKHFIQVEEFPRTPSGKVMKFVLREQYAGSFTVA